MQQGYADKMKGVLVASELGVMTNMDLLEFENVNEHAKSRYKSISLIS